MSEQIKRVNRELKFKGTIIDFYQDTMEINGDHTVVWDFIKHKGAAAVVPVTEDGKILMVRQYRNALERYTFEIPAGALDEEGEPGFKCAARELEEETGYKSEELEWLITLRTTVAFCNEKIEVYVAKNLIPSKQHLDEDEFIDLKAYSLDELKEKIGIKKTIKDYVPDEKDFLDRLDAMCEQAFDDQCTGANPRYPLISEIKDMYLRAYYGK